MAKPSALPIFQRTFASKPFKMSEADVRTLHQDWGKTVKEGEGQNRNALAQAALKLAKQDWHAPLDEIAEHRGSWSPAFGRETFSPEYSGWWAMSLAVLFGDDWWDAVGKVWIGAHALAAIDPPKKILLTTLRETSQRTLTGGAAWQWGNAPFSQMPGPRFLWADPLTASTLIQRAIIHPCLGLASKRGAKITNWEHENFGLPLAVLLGKKAKKPASWGTVELGREAVAHLDWLPPMAAKDWVRYQWFEDGTQIVGMSRGKTGTRGTVPLSVSKDGVVTYYTTAQGTGKAGGWTQCGSKPVGKKKWVVESSSGKLEVETPGTPTLEVLWDAEGARIVSGSIDTKPTPPKPAPPKPEEPAKKPANVAKAIEWATTLPGLADQVRGSSAAEKQALGKIRNRGNQIVKLLPGGVQEAVRWAKTLPELAAQVAGSNAAEKQALGKIRNRGNQIVKLLEA